MKMPKPTEGGNFEPVPEGLHFAVCYQVIDLGTQTTEWSGVKKDQHKVQISWEIPEERITTEDGREFPMSIHNRYTLSSHPEANLRKHLESWRGRSFTDEELDPDNPNGFDIKNLLGKACQINVTHNHKGDRTYANIASIVPKPKGVTDPTAENTMIYFAMDRPDQFDREVFNLLPEWLQDVIKKSPQYQHANGSVQSSAPLVNDMVDDEIPF